MSDINEAGTVDVQVKEDNPGDDDGQAPFRALEFGADVMDRSCIVCVDVKLDILEIRGVVEHVEYEAKGKGGLGNQELKDWQPHT